MSRLVDLDAYMKAVCPVCQARGTDICLSHSGKPLFQMHRGRQELIDGLAREGEAKWNEERETFHREAPEVMVMRTYDGQTQRFLPYRARGRRR